MAEPVLRDPATPEPVRRPGPQPVRAASSDPLIDPAHELPSPGTELPDSTESISHAQTAPLPAGIPDSKARGSSRETMSELSRHVDEFRERVGKQASEVGVSLKREFGQDVDYVKIRARYYHERRPLQTLGVVAAAGFLFGVFAGMWRR